MKAIVANAYGGPEVLQLQHIAKPQPKPTELLVRNVNTAATTADTMLRTGTPWYGRLMIGLRKPKASVPGTGFAGIVEAVGDSVTQFQVGDRVFGEMGFAFGAYAEYVTVPEDGLVLLMPENLPFSEAASFTDGHLTSYNFLQRMAQLKPGQHILINGAAGSLGSSAVQLAKYIGATVTGVCSTRNLGLVKSLGADVVIDYTQEDFSAGEELYDFVYDSVGKSSFAQAKRVLKPGGSYLSPVLSMKLLGNMLWTSLFGRKKAQFDATGARPLPELTAMMGELIAIYEAGGLTTLIDRQYPLEKMAEAHGYLSSGRKKGNVVITIQEAA